MNTSRIGTTDNRRADPGTTAIDTDGTRSPPSLTIVVPCYNEEAVLAETGRQLSVLLDALTTAGKIAANSSVLFVDDGSSDLTWNCVETLAASDARLKGIKLSRNRGHQNALLAGLLRADGDVVVSIDADLQDDLEAVGEMMDAYGKGSDIVLGVRKDRSVDSLFKRFTAELYYRMLRAMGVGIVFNHADYRLMARRAVEGLREYGEVNLFLRGIIPQLGFQSTIVYYDRAERLAGESKYSLTRMLALAWEGITSFSAIPLRLITAVGAVVSLASFLVTAWALWVRLFTSAALPGWASTVLPIYFLGGVQLLCLGIIGEYIAKVYMETKRRPRYLIERTIGVTDAGCRR